MADTKPTRSSKTPPAAPQSRAQPPPLEPTDEELRGPLPASALAGVVAARLVIRMGGFVEEHNLGICGTGGSAFRLDKAFDFLHLPTLWFIRATRVPAEGVLRSIWPGAPDIAVDVLSSGEEASAARARATEYLDNGGRLVWVIDPERRTATVYRLSAAPQVLQEEDELDGRDVVRGFTVRLRDLFPPQERART